GERQRMGAVDQGEETRFLAVEELLDHQLRARRAEAPRQHRLVDGGERLLDGRSDGDAFAGGESVRLDDDRCAAPADELLRRLGLAKAPVGGGGDAVFGAEILGEAFRALERGGGRAGAEGGESRRFESVDEAGDKGRLGPYHD